jgi:hypothetical protein
MLNKAKPSIPIASSQNNMVGKMSDNAKLDIGGVYEMSITEEVANKTCSFKREGGMYGRV